MNKAQKLVMCYNNPMRKYVPTENEEAETFADYLRKSGLRFSHVVNELKTRNWGAWQRSKQLGVNPGVPDYIIVCGNTLAFVELKRTKGGKVSEEQILWIAALQKCEGVRAAVCYGAKEAIKFVEEIKAITK